MDLIVAIRDMSAGNETVGDMWQETKVFRADAPISEVMEWAGRKKRVQITVPDNTHEDDIPF